MSPETEKGRIRRLPEDVVNRIAAGEVVCRPSAALKELLENSLDAGATTISVNVREGGLKLLQVTDDGKGIPYDDLALLCERFATSKIAAYEDLEHVQTFGFRGEALASMSNVSRLTVLTKTRESSVAFKASYLSGSMRAPPEATAGVDGTTITLEEMFYNLPTRRRALKTSSDEYRLVLDVVTRYAIHYPQVSFVCRRQQSGSASRISSSSDFRTELNSTVSANIRNAFGSNLSHETLSFQLDVGRAETEVSAVVSTANYSVKKGIFILFVNGRLVECQPLKRSIWATYSSFLPKNTFPFAYVSLRMKQVNVDVNVHPTKKEVRFLHESLIIDSFVEELSNRLKGTETSRTFLAQAVIRTDRPVDTPSRNLKPNSLASSLLASDTRLAENDTEMMLSKKHANSQDLPSHPNLMSRSFDVGTASLNTDALRPTTDGKEGFPAHGKLDVNISSSKVIKQTYFKPRSASGVTDTRASTGKTVYPKDKVRTGANAPVGLYDVFLTQSIEQSAALEVQGKRRRRPGARPLLTSVENLLLKLRKECHQGLSEVLKEHLFIGVASVKYVLLQHNTKLLLADIDQLIVELMHQQVLIKFADHDNFKLTPSAPVLRLVDCYISNTAGSQIRNKVEAQSCVTVLMEKASMLEEYFGMRFGGACLNTFVLEQLPMILPSLVPGMELLGRFLYCLAVETDWSAEEPCFRDVSLRIAEWYGKSWTTLQGAKQMESYATEDTENNASKNHDCGNREHLGTNRGERGGREWVLRHVLFAAMRSDFYPPRRFFFDEVVREITSTARLYKVFERC